MISLLSHNIEDTYAIGQSLGKILQKSIFIALDGSVGAGKTHFVQGLAKGLAVPQTPRSPTFSIMEEYAGRIPLLHVDVYRLEEEELEPLGLEEQLEGWSGVIAMEWAERFPMLYPSEPLHIEISLLGNQGRKITVSGSSHTSILEELAQSCASFLVSH